MSDPFAATRDLFELPEGLIYMVGNSLGAMPRGVKPRMAAMLGEEWGAQLVAGWNGAGWFDLPRRLGDRIGAMLGAAPGSVMVADSTTLNTFKLLVAALRLAPGRRVILSDKGNFPTDLYVAQGLAGMLGQGHRLETVAPEALEGAIGADVGVLLVTEVDYSTGRRHDVPALVARARAHGVPVVLDLCHSAGALPVDLTALGVEFAVGCGYKYLNGGPGAPSYAYVRPDLQADFASPLWGWMGHAAPFDFAPDYRPAEGINRLRVGTPPIVSMTALDAALDVWAGVDMAMVRTRSLAMSDAMIAAVEADCPGLELLTPRDHAARGSQVCFRFEHAYAAIRALMAEGVHGDFRAPHTMRFGLTPLYVSVAEAEEAGRRIARVINSRAWDRPEYHARTAVT